MELCLGHTTSVRQKTRSGKVANRATSGVGELWPEKSMMVMIDQQRYQYLKSWSQVSGCSPEPR